MLLPIAARARYKCVLRTEGYATFQLQCLISALLCIYEEVLGRRAQFSIGTITNTCDLARSNSKTGIFPGHLETAQTQYFNYKKRTGWMPLRSLETFATVKGKSRESVRRKASGLTANCAWRPGCHLANSEDHLQKEMRGRTGRKTNFIYALPRVGAVTMMSLGWFNCFAGASPNKCDKQISDQINSSAKGPVKLVVSFKQNPTAAQTATLKRLGFSVDRHLPIINALGGMIPRANLGKLAALPFVKRLSSDETVQRCDSFTVDSSLANVAWGQYKTAGVGVGVAVIDSGTYDANPDLSSVQGLLGLVGIGHRVTADVDFTGLGTQDQCGHGTHVAGIIGGDGSQSSFVLDKQTFYGIAPGASIINVRVLNAQGEGTVSNVISGVQWCVTNAKKYNIRVINLSMGHPVGQSYTTDPLCQAVEQAWKSGIVVVCAAGNSGRLNANPTAGAGNSGYGTAYWSVESPGNDPYVITVGATKSVDGKRADDQIASYSGRGPSQLDFVLKPDIIAPGNRVISCEDPNHSYLTTTYGSQVEIANSTYQTLGVGYSSAYFCLSGTSMATPVVSGAVALMLQAHPTLTPDTVKARLMISADKWAYANGLGDPCTFGAGYLDIPAAIACTATPATSALSPTLTANGSGSVYVSLNPQIYGQNAMWGTGTSVEGIYGSQAMWGTGGNTLTDSNAMWGTGGYWTETSSNVTYSSSSLDMSSTSILSHGD
jgi:serine protease AprX